jgi:hypothetical protein
MNGTGGRRAALIRAAGTGRCLRSRVSTALKADCFECRDGICAVSPLQWAVARHRAIDLETLRNPNWIPYTTRRRRAKPIKPSMLEPRSTRVPGSGELMGFPLMVTPSKAKPESNIWSFALTTPTSR